MSADSHFTVTLFIRYVLLGSGAVVSRKEEPMLVMEFMEHGSLHDLLHNDTVFIEGELILPILRDVAQGMRFLHAASPQVLHGDIKAANVLVDNKFRAKVAGKSTTMAATKSYRLQIVVTHT
jgi:serine/threonine protein kinase